MKATLDIAKKELRSIFESPVALLFLGVFLTTSLFLFFTISGFFSRNLADVRALFQWLPILLIVLVSATTMGQWAEEKKTGTIEVLLTLPVHTYELVLGKFLASLALVAIALALTFPLPLTVSMMGSLDLGPVLGGYLGALLLGSAYVSLGLCASARTDNQVVALIATLFLGAVLYLVGSGPITGLFANDMAELLRDIGTGSRFESIERGVLDLRDFVYYGSLSALFLSLNIYFLEVSRIDRQTNPRRTRRLQSLLLLITANVIVLNIWLAPLNGLRIDLTENGDYSISEATENTLSELNEPLYIEAYFSQRTHPLLSPLVPQISDLLAEYVVAGQGQVNLSILDPGSDDELAQRIGEQYGIRSVPFGVTERNAQSVINAWFHVLVKYGDKYEVLSFNQLIEVHSQGTEIDVRLRNLEYDLTRTIRRVSQDFQTIESLISGLPDGTTMTLYATPGNIPSDFQETLTQLKTVATTIAEASDGRVPLTEVDPLSQPNLPQELDSRLGLRPLAADLFGRKVFYMHLVLESNGKVERLLPSGGMGEPEIKRSIEAAIKRLSPGQLKTVGVLTGIPVAPPPNPQIPPQYQPPPPQPDFQALKSLLAEDYGIEEVDVSSGEVPDHLDVLVIGKPGSLQDRELFAIDQYLMRGGSVIALAGSWKAKTDQGELNVERTSPVLSEMLKTWGVEVESSLIMDAQNAPFPIPVKEQRGPFVMNRIELIPYPFFPDIRRDGYLEGHPSLTGLNNVTVPWASPLSIVADIEGVESSIILQTSPESALNFDGNIQPDFAQWPNEGFGVTGNQERRPVAAVLSGTFPSHFANRPSPMWDSHGDANSDGDRTGRTIKTAAPEARLAVIGSSEIVSDLMLQVARQMSGEVHRSNLQLLHNLVDWTVEDTDLLSIRSSGAFARTLKPLSEEERNQWEMINYIGVIIGLAIIAWIPRYRRRRKTSLTTLRTENPS